jgi:Integrase zinc binding domain
MEAHFKENWLPESTDTPRNICAYTLSNLLQNENVNTVASNAATTFATQKDMDTELFPMSPELITKEQKGDQPLKEQTIEGLPLLTLENRIIIPEVLHQHIVAWYHLYLKHPGQTQMENTLNSVYWWKNM